MMQQMKLSARAAIDPPEAKSINDPKHWRDRAEEARSVGEMMNDHHARRMMLGVAKTYEKLASGAEDRLKLR